MSSSKKVDNSFWIKKLKARKVFKEVFLNQNLETRSYVTPRDYVSDLWLIYENLKKGKKVNNSEPGSAFEIIFGFLLDREGIKIHSMNQEIVFMVKPDFLIEKNGTFHFLSLKTSSRERWKQADWEALRMKQKFPKTKNYLIFNNQKDTNYVKSFLHKTEIDECFFAQSKDLNLFFKKI